MKKFKLIAFYSLASVLLITVIGFSMVKHSGKIIRDVKVDIRYEEDNVFTDQLEILKLVNADNTDPVLGYTVGELDLKSLEARVEKNQFVKDAQIYRDLKGNLVVRVQQVRPIARVLDRKGADHYIDHEGYLVPTSIRHTARVPILEFDKMPAWKANLGETEYGTRLLSLLNYIDQDEFWHAQIAGLVVKKDGDIRMLPQVTKQDILFGQPEDLDTKFLKLRLFYKEILPNKGWNSYSIVNVKFKNQIICE